MLCVRCVLCVRESAAERQTPAGQACDEQLPGATASGLGGPLGLLQDRSPRLRHSIADYTTRTANGGHQPTHKPTRHGYLHPRTGTGKWGDQRIIVVDNTGEMRQGRLTYNVQQTDALYNEFQLQ